MAGGGPGATDAFDDGLDDDVELALDHLAHWAAESRVADAVSERRRAAWLARQSGVELTLGRILSGLAERGRPVVVELLDGRRHRGTPVTVGRDVVELEVTGGGRVLVAAAAVASVRAGGSELAGPDVGLPTPSTDLAAELARWAEERPRVLARPRTGAGSLTGTLLAAGSDLLVMRLEGGDVAYVPLAALAEVSLPESG
jgi:hypothetical protein